MLANVSPDASEISLDISVTWYVADVIRARDSETCGDVTLPSLVMARHSNPLTQPCRPTFSSLKFQTVNDDEGTGSWLEMSAEDADHYLYQGDDFQWKNGYDTLITHLKVMTALRWLLMGGVAWLTSSRWSWHQLTFLSISVLPFRLCYFCFQMS